MPAKEVKTLSTLKVQRKAALKTLETVEKFILDFETDRDRCQLKVRIETLDRVKGVFLKVQDELEKLDSADALEVHLEERASFEERYCVAVGFLQSKVPDDPNQSLSSTMISAPQYSSFHLRLPQIDLPRFNGDFSRWMTFKDTFTSMVHCNADIPTVAKLQYLLMSLEGDAKKPYESIDIKADNYSSTWESLVKRYDNRRFLKRQLFRSLYDLPALKQESAKRLHTLVDDFERLVRALAKLGEPVKHWDTPLVYLLSYKLDQGTLRAWEEKTSDKDDVTYEEMVKFLHQRVRVLNSVGPEVQQQQSSSTKVAGSNGSKGSKVKFAANTAAASSKSSESSASCPLGCADSHSVRNCPTFAQKDVSQRRQIVSQKRLCWNCLSSGHPSKKCNSKYTCQVCKEKHHSLLHSGSTSKVSATPAVSSSAVAQQPLPSTSAHVEPASSSAPPQISMSARTECTTVLLETVVLNVVDDHGQEHKARALLDSGSMSNFISKQLAKQLFNPRSKVDIQVAGIGLSLQKVKNAITTTIESRTTSFSTKLEFLILKQPSALLPTLPIDTSSWKFPDVALADPQFNIPERIDLVIGSEAFWELHTGRKIALGSGLPWIVETPFGWAVAGSTPSQATCVPRICNLSTTDEALEASLQRFWELETVFDQPPHSVEENRCEQFYASTTTREPSGRYVVRLPRTDNPEITLGSSRDIAERRFFSLERRLQRDPSVRESYHRFMEEYSKLGHMRRLEEPVDDTKLHCYLPHHPVFKASSTTTKTRVVFDASCKTASGHALNNYILVGPVVQQDLISIIMRHRTRAIALVADIEKMYRQIALHPEDQSLQRILWRTDPSEPISTYELQTVTYGTASAPYLATRTLQQVASDYKDEYPAASQAVSKDFYVDDLLSGADDVDAAIQLRKDVSQMLNAAGLPIKKWASNSPDALVDVPPEDLALQPVHDLQDEQAVSTLGLVWEPRFDVLRFKIQLPLPAAVLTKRKVMSYIAQIFDPLGLVGPAITVAKLFMQRLWALKKSKESCEWDTALPLKLQEEWKQYHSTLHLLGDIRIPRYVLQPKAVNIQLHFFCDASEKAYGTCCFVRAEAAAGGISVHLLASKSKVVPLTNSHSIARLELCGARLSIQLFKKVNAALNIEATAFFWTDSTTVLHWLRATPSRWKPFVANRVAQIQQATNVENWKHVAGVDNPADDISRGLPPTELITRKRWWNGPDWLSLAPELWPKTILSEDGLTAASAEGRKPSVVAMTVVESQFCENLFARYESFVKLRRVTAFCFRFLRHLKERAELRRTEPEKYKPLAISPTVTTTINESVRPLTAEELRSAELRLCRLAQRESFVDDIDNLTGGKCVTKTSKLKWLNPFLDDDGTLRVGGRLRHAVMPMSAKHPLVLSAKHPLSSLLARYYHLKLLHAGPQLLLATLRQRYWILGGRNLTKSVFHQCHTCFRSKPTLVQQSTSDLPASRVSPTRPFSVCGVDYCGPFFLKSEVRNRGPTKAYVAIFVCFATRAVHIELVGDLTTASFLAALRRMVSYRGMVAELHSDNATTFKGAAHELNRVYRMLKVNADDQNRIVNWCSENGITWKFIPPRAPHFGGLWEAAVKSAKFHLLKTLGNVSVKSEEMRTILAQVEMCLNSRPLTPMPSDPQDLEVLTPGHFLIGTNMQAVPDVDRRNIPDNRLDSWDLAQKNFQGIWSRWYPEYLQQLHSRAAKGCNPPVSIEVGRIVVVKEDNVPPASWPIAKIVKLHPGKDGVVRVVTLRTPTAKEVVRPVARLALLPMPNPQPTN